MSTYPLNIFQRLTRQWDALHPYNAAQLMRLPGKPDASAIEEAWRAALADLSLGVVTVSRGRYRFTPPEESTPLVAIVPGGFDLETFLTNEMNRPFAATGAMPLRPFVLREKGSYWFGVVYHHWIADSVSIRSLLRQWFARRFVPELIEKIIVPTVSQRGYWRLFGPDARRWDLPGAVLDVLRWSGRLRRARRIESEHFSDMQIRFKLHRLPDGVAGPLVNAARKMDATVNDLFLAAMAETSDRYLCAAATPRRNNLALGVIADLRNGAPALNDVFGLFLGFTSVICRNRDLHDWPHLVQSIAEQNRQQRNEHARESSMVKLLAGLISGKLQTRRQLLEFYRKRLPLSAGISNVNLNQTWVSHYHPDPILEYIRVSPTGPMLPLVFTPSTLGKTMHFGLTHRSAVVPAATADACGDDFAERLISIIPSMTIRKLPQQREAS